MMPYNSEQPSSLEPPKHDTLIIMFRGDPCPIILPYCEAANGDIREITKDKVIITMPADDEEPEETVELSYEGFVDTVEGSFDTKEIIELYIQFAESTSAVKIL